MKTAPAILLALISLQVCAIAAGHTLTFDETAPPGAPDWWLWDLYATDYGVLFNSGDWTAANHSNSTWGPPHSGSMVLTNGLWSGQSPSLAMVKLAHGYPGPLRPYSIYSLGAYFSTEPGVLIKFVGYDYYSRPIASAYVGAPGESWNNRYVEINSPAGSIYGGVMFFPVSSGDALLHYSADDLTVVPVPEPSTLAFLSLALASLGIGVARRRR